MKSYDARSMDLMEGWLDSGLALHLRSRFSMHGEHDARRSAIRFLQLEAAERIAGEVGSQQTMLLVLDGEAWVETRGERHVFDRGAVALIPAFVPYTVGNDAAQPAHLLCLLPDAAIASIFVAPLKPLRIEIANGSDSPRTALAG